MIEIPVLAPCLTCFFSHRPATVPLTSMGGKNHHYYNFFASVCLFPRGNVFYTFDFFSGLSGEVARVVACELSVLVRLLRTSSPPSPRAALRTTPGRFLPQDTSVVYMVYVSGFSPFFSHAQVGRCPRSYGSTHGSCRHNRERTQTCWNCPVSVQGGRKVLGPGMS